MSKDLKLQLKKTLLKRKYNPSLYRQINSDLFTLVIGNTLQDSHIKKDFQKYLDGNNIKDKR